MLQTKLDLVRREGIKNYLTEIIIRNGGVLFAKVLNYSKDGKRIVLQPHTRKDSPISHLRLLHRIKYNKMHQCVIFPKNLIYIPVFIHFPLTFNRSNVEEEHMFVADVELMNKELAKRHLKILEERLNEQHEIVLNLRVVHFVNRVMLRFTSDYLLTVDIIKYIVNYFKSFGVIAFIEQ